MKKILLLAAVLLLSSQAFAGLPSLQLFIDGAYYDTVEESWVTTGSSIDLYVVASIDLDNVIISAALSPTDFGKYDNPNGVADVTFNGSAGAPWVYGYSPYDTYLTWDNSADLAQHGVFPTWFTEFNTGNYDVSAGGGIGNTMPGPDFFDPSLGYINSNHQGMIKKITIEADGMNHIHFDAYTVNSDGEIVYFAPFSHDGEMTVVPEPGTILLFSAGLAGAGMYRRMRRKD